jgi:hypothetical protein
MIEYDNNDTETLANVLLTKIDEDETDLQVGQRVIIANNVD